MDPVAGTVPLRVKYTRLPVGRLQLSRAPQFLPNACSMGPTGEAAEDTPDPGPYADLGACEACAFKTATPPVVTVV